MNAWIKRLARTVWDCTRCGKTRNSDDASNCGGCGRPW